MRLGSLAILVLALAACRERTPSGGPAATSTGTPTGPATPGTSPDPGPAGPGAPPGTPDPGTAPGTDPALPTTPAPGSSTAQPEGPLSGALALRRALSYPTRVAEGPTGRVYVTDARQGAVFVLNAALVPIGELRGLGLPLGVAVASDGAACVGSRTRRAVLCFGGDGALARTIGEGALEMPNDLAVDRAGNLYVADSTANRVQVFGPGGALLRSVGVPGVAPVALAFPAAVTVAYPPAHPEGELYVADQRNGRVAVFDLQGAFRRALGSPAAAFSGAWQGRFTRLQGVAVDALGRVHALDAYQNTVQVLDGQTGAFVEAYGSFGSGPGQLSVPLGLAVLRDGRVLVTSSETRRVELLRTLAPGQGG